MTRNDVSTRRSFLKTAAVLCAPLAAAPVSALAGDESRARLARLEDESALRDLQQAWLRSVNAGRASDKKIVFTDRPTANEKVRSIAAQYAGPPDEIKIGPDGKIATGRFHCAVGIETLLAEDCTLVQMARLQGDGFVRRVESHILIIDYAKADGAWSIARVKLLAAQT